jgi:hypothetical protein
VKFQHVGSTDHSEFFEWFSSSSIEELVFTICRKSSTYEKISDLVERDTIEDRSSDLDTKSFCG